MSSILKVDTIQDQSGNNIINESGNVITIGASGDTITVPAGATVSGFTSAGIDDNATSTAITISSAENVGIGGAASSTQRLIVNGDGSNIIGGIEFRNAASGGSTASIGMASGTSNALSIAVNDAANMVFKNTGGTERMRITSAGLVGIGTSSPTHNLTVDGGTSTSVSLIKDETGSATVRYYNGGSQKSYIQLTANEDMDFYAASGVDQVFYGNGAEVMRLSSGVVFNEGSGDRDFRVESNANANMLFVDGGNNRVGIGTSAPTVPLMVQSDQTQPLLLKGANDKQMVVETTGGSTQITSYQLKNSAYAWQIENGRSANTFTIRSSGGGERVRIDASGNLLVGMTSNGVHNSGIGLVPNGISHFYTGGNRALELGRGVSDGEILRFNRSGTTIGSIGVVNSNNLFIQGDSTNSGLQCGTDAILPVKNTANSDNTINLGQADIRWKDIYLSGGAYIGGTSTPNKLDDYEEGTWTPTVSTATGFSTGVTSTNYATYTKIGNTVFIRSNFQLGNSSGNLTAGDVIQLTGLPFAPVAQDHVIQCGYRYNNTNNGVLSVTTAATTNRLYIICVSVTGSPARNGGGVAINFTYKV